MQTEAQTGGAIAAAIPQTPYDRVQALRIARGWSESEACRQAGVARNLLAQKRDRKTLSDESLAAFAKAYGVPVEDLTRDTVAAPKPGALPIAVPGAATIDPASTRVPWHRLVASTFNPRRTFDEALLAELADSIATSGLLQNLVVRELPGDGAPLTIADGEGNRVRMLEVIAGERRYRAIGMLVKDGRWNPDEANVAVKILDAGDGDALAVALLENLQREDVPPIEEAEAFARLNDLDKATWTPAAIAARIHKSERHVQARIALARKLTDETKTALAEGRINLSQARAIALAAPKQQAKLVGEAAVNRWMTEEKIRDQLIRNLPQVGLELFDLAAYTGEFIEPDTADGTEGEPRRFADRKEFDRLQKPFIDAKIAKLKTKWGTVDVRKGTPYWWDYEETKGKGAVLFIEASGRIHQRTGLTRKAAGVGAPRSVTTGETPEERQAREAAAAEREAARARFAKDMREALKYRPALALLVLIADMLDCGMPTDIEYGFVEDADQDADLAAYRGINDAMARLARLEALPEADRLQVLARLIAEQIDPFGWHALPAPRAWLAKALGLTPPADMPAAAAPADAAEDDAGEEDDGTGEFGDGEEG